MTTILDDPARPDDHRLRKGGPVATQIREAFRVGQDEAFIEECLAVSERISNAIRAGTYGIAPDADPADRPMLRSTVGDDLPILAVPSALHDDEHAGRTLDATIVLPALERTSMSPGCRSRHPLALPALVRAMTDGTIMQPDMNQWRAVVRLPTPWSPATIESDAAGTDGTGPVVCGPEADRLPTECRLLVQRKADPGRPARRWIWTLTTQTVHFDTRRMPDAIETMRILAGMEGKEGSR